MLDFLLQNLTFVFIVVTATIMLVHNYKENRHIVLLFLFLVFASIVQLTLKLVINGESPEVIAFIFYSFTPVSLLTGPSIYFFFKKLINPDWRFKRVDLLHLIPAVLSLIFVLPYIFTSFEYKLEVAHKFIAMPGDFIQLDLKQIIPNQVNFSLRLVSNLIYLGLSFVILYRYQHKLNKLKQQISIKHDKNLVWIWLLLFLFLTVITLLIIVISGLIFMDIINKRDSYLGSIAMALRLFFLAIPLSILFFPKVLTELRLRKLVEQPVRKSGEFEYLMSQIKHYMETEKPFLNPKFSRNDLCKALNISLQQMQNCLSNSDPNNFVELKNKYRIQHAMELMKNESSKGFTLEAIANQSGFTSYSNFYAIFKEFSGMTPNQWIKVHSK